MNYLNKIIGSVVGKGSSWDSVFLKNLETKYFGDTIDTKPYKASQLVYVCISTTARAISQVPLMVMRPAGPEGKKKSFKQIDRMRFAELKSLALRSDSVAEKLLDQAIKNSELEPVEAGNPWQTLIDRPNPYMDGSIFKYSLIGYILLNGNVWAVPFPPDSKMPLQIWVVAQESMEPVMSRTTGHLEGWKYQPRGLQFSINLKPEEICHMRLWSPYDPIMGQAPLEAGKIEIRTDYKASIYNENFFDDGAVPEGIVYTEKKIKQSKKDKTVEAIENRHKGYRKSHRVMMLDQALKFQKIGLTQKEMDFKELRGYSRETVFQTFGMKKAVVAVTDDLNYATAKSQEKGWWNNTNLPLMRMISASLNSNLFANLPYVVWWDKSNIEALQEDYSEQVDVAKKLFFMGYTRNQVNDKLELGFEPDTAGDVSYLNQGLKPVADNGILRPEPEPIEQIVPTEPSKTIKNVPLKQISAPISKDWDEKAGKVWDELQSGIESIQTVFEKKVKRVLFEMRKSVIGMANGQRYDKSVKKEIIPSPQQLLQDIDDVNFEREKELLDRLVKDLYDRSISLGAESVANELGVSMAFDIVDPSSLQYISVRRLKVVGVLNTVKKQIRSAIHDGMQDGESIDQIANRIKSVFKTSTKRAKTIARTEVIGTTNFGRFGQMQHTGYTRKKWFTAKDERVRSDHAKMHGESVEIGNKWILPDGSQLRYPGDYMGTAKQVINCRCIEVVDLDSFNPESLGIVSQQDIDNLGPKKE